MRSLRSKVRHFKAPFVVTLALGATPGCSGKTTHGGETTPETSCPAAAPVSGTRCDYEGPACGYDDCGGAPSRSATCDEGTWTVSQWSCNPPPPPNTVCPAVLPTAEGYCDYQGPTCSYGSCAGGSIAEHRAECVTGTWKVGTVRHCDGASSVCPAIAPTAGTSCSHLGGVCGYDSCGGTPATRAWCTGGVWTIDRRSCNPPPPPVTVCPADVPSAGAYCNYAGPPCGYDDCDGILTTEASCKEQVWVVLRGSCNPPPPSCDAGSCSPIDAGTPPADAASAG